MGVLFSLFGVEQQDMNFVYVNKSETVSLCYSTNKINNVYLFKWAIQSYYDEIGEKPIFIHDNKNCDFRLVSRYHHVKNSSEITIAIVGEVFEGEVTLGAVSYTHLTLPTILRV